MLFLLVFCVVFVAKQEVTADGKGSKEVGMDMYTFCEALGPEEVRQASSSNDYPVVGHK